ncbi:hypothetical protein PR202_gb03540 [Eleusine coracana subsp. coracana]|uniref:Uncharacterized protein n=1 Tax=Eleusine coracana subsp. coracana TaxID=191504 RepID=A0AAV5E0J9_ELECO|nr:hypothetical protein PR202_gb03540 [Eleusine coracana subsp. coracana]
MTTAESILNPYRWSQLLHQSTRNREDYSVFRVSAWCLKPDEIPSSRDLHIVEPPVGPIFLPPGKPTLQYPIDIKVVSADSPGVDDTSPPSDDDDEDARRQRRRRRRDPSPAPGRSWPPSRAGVKSSPLRRLSRHDRLGPADSGGHTVVSTVEVGEPAVVPDQDPSSPTTAVSSTWVPTSTVEGSVLAVGELDSPTAAGLSTSTAVPSSPAHSDECHVAEVDAGSSPSKASPSVSSLGTVVKETPACSTVMEQPSNGEVPEPAATPLKMCFQLNRLLSLSRNLHNQVRWLWLAKTDPDRLWQGLDIPVHKNSKAFFNTAVQSYHGRGDNILFWKDKWLFGSSIADLAPTVITAVPIKIQQQRTAEDALTNHLWVKDIQGGAISVKRGAGKDVFFASVADETTVTRMIDTEPYSGLGTLHLHLRRWTRQAFASGTFLLALVDVEMCGIPAHAWDMSIAEGLLSPYGWPHMLHPATRDREDYSVFRVLAWCFKPDSLPNTRDLHVVELSIGVIESPPGKPTLVYTISSSVTAATL